MSWAVKALPMPLGLPLELSGSGESDMAAGLGRLFEMGAAAAAAAECEAGRGICALTWAEVASVPSTDGLGFHRGREERTKGGEDGGLQVIRERGRLQGTAKA